LSREEDPSEIRSLNTAVSHATTNAAHHRGRTIVDSEDPNRPTNSSFLITFLLAHGRPLSLSSLARGARFLPCRMTTRFCGDSGSPALPCCSPVPPPAWPACDAVSLLFAFAGSANENSNLNWISCFRIFALESRVFGFKSGQGSNTQTFLIPNSGISVKHIVVTLVVPHGPGWMEQPQCLLLPGETSGDHFSVQNHADAVRFNAL